MQQQGKQPTVLYMGKPMSHEDLPNTPPIEMEDVFKAPILSIRAIDSASKYVPQKVFEQLGIYTWLLAKAAVAFKHLPVSKHEIQMGKLLYKFEYEHMGPILANVVYKP